MTDHMGADPPDSQVLNGVQTSLVQSVEVAADIVFTPRAECGPIRVIYLSAESAPGDGSSVSADDPYRVTVVQEMLVEIPVTFQIDAACDGVTCAPLPDAAGVGEACAPLPGSESGPKSEPGSGLRPESDDRPAQVAARDSAQNWQPWQSRKGPLWTWRTVEPPQGRG